MVDYEKLGAFYLGKVYDVKAQDIKDEILLYDSKDLTTHAVCVGMTGSGKTGLCIGLIEEAAIDGVPAILIDPKGDLGNLLLTFPNLEGSDFLPWVNPDEARNKNLSPEEFAEALEEVFNVDSYLRYMAVIALIMNWDSYPWTGNNFFLFHDPVTDKFEWIPWDLTWGGDASMPIFERTQPTISPYAPLYENVFKVEKYKRQYSAYLDLLIREFFNYDNIYQVSKEYHELIEPYVTQSTGDKVYFGESAWFPIEEFYNSWKHLAINAGNRAEFVSEIINTIYNNN